MTKLLTAHSGLEDRSSENYTTVFNNVHLSLSEVKVTVAELQLRTYKRFTLRVFISGQFCNLFVLQRYNSKCRLGVDHYHFVSCRQSSSQVRAPNTNCEG